jgi:NAD(P)-dependent dehydrogenase (short-subunit alcohol dehydrogenase family)
VLAHGHNLIATSRNPSRTPALVAEIESQSHPGGGSGRWLPLDVDDPAAGPALIDKLESEGTQIDVLVNNAGFSIHAPVETLTEEELRRMMETMYFGPARLIRAVVPYMRERRFGVVVSMSTGAGLEGRESMGGYAGAKAAVDGEYSFFFFFPFFCVCNK